MKTFICILIMSFLSVGCDFPQQPNYSQNVQQQFDDYDDDFEIEIDFDGHKKKKKKTSYYTSKTLSNKKQTNKSSSRKK